MLEDESSQFYGKYTLPEQLETGNISDEGDLASAIDTWNDSLAEAEGAGNFYGHGNYSVKAATRAGYLLSVKIIDNDD